MNDSSNPLKQPPEVTWFGRPWQSPQTAVACWPQSGLVAVHPSDRRSRQLSHTTYRRSFCGQNNFKFLHQISRKHTYSFVFSSRRLRCTVHRNFGSKTFRKNISSFRLGRSFPSTIVTLRIVDLRSRPIVITIAGLHV